MKASLCSWMLLLFLLGWSRAGAQIVLNEVMYDPLGPEAHDEYVELANISRTRSVDLSGWRLGDAGELDALVEAGSGWVLAPGQFALVLDGSYFGHSTTYENVPKSTILLTIEDRAFGRSGWSNSREESVVLVDAAGDTVEVFRYSPASKPGLSWEKVDPGGGRAADNWALALVEGGTPGRINSAYEQARAAGQAMVLEVQPNPFAARTRLEVRLSRAPALVHVWIYDLEGRRRRQLLREARSGARLAVEWDGRDDQGRPLPPGMYIVYVEASAEGRIARLRKVIVRRAR